LPDIELLTFIAVKAGLNSTFFTSTAKIASRFHISQQSVSRKLRALASEGLVEFSSSPKGVRVKLSAKGASILKSRFVELKQVFASHPAPFLEGSLESGLGEGSYYMSQAKYVSQFEQKLGFRPFAGTLNHGVSEEKLAGFLSQLEEIAIKGFRTGQRSFGSIRAFPVLVEKKYGAAIIFPERSSHESNVIEVICRENLRKKLKLKEGSSVKLFSEKL